MSDDPSCVSAGVMVQLIAEPGGDTGVGRVETKGVP
jgi:hypothetical protein